MENFPDMTMTVLDDALRMSDPGQVDDDPKPERPDPEVPQRARRRTFTANTSRTSSPSTTRRPDGEKRALLRREELYSSRHIVEWRRARDAGALTALTAPRGRRGESRAM